MSIEGTKAPVLQPDQVRTTKDESVQADQIAEPGQSYVERLVDSSTDPFSRLQRLHAPQQYAAIQRMQQVHGNQYVQRQQRPNSQPPGLFDYIINPFKGAFSPFQTWKPSGEYTIGQDDIKTIEDIAEAHYGRIEKTFINAILKANPGVKPNRLVDEQKIKVPGRFVAQNHTIGDVKAHKLNMNFTKSNEGSADPKSKYYYLKLHLPPGASGVTIGPGYDLGSRSQKSAKADLMAAGIESVKADRISKGAGKKGKQAGAFVKENSDITITVEQANALYDIAYTKEFNETLRVIIETYEQEWPRQGLRIKNKILETLVDLKFRGDLKSETWQHVKPAVVSNDLNVLKEAMCARKNWKDVPYERYASRCQYVGGTPEPKTESD